MDGQGERVRVDDPPSRVVSTADEFTYVDIGAGAPA